MGFWHSTHALQKIVLSILFSTCAVNCSILILRFRKQIKQPNPKNQKEIPNLFKDGQKKHKSEIYRRILNN